MHITGFQSYFFYWVEIPFFFLPSDLLQSKFNMTQITLVSPLLWEENVL